MRLPNPASSPKGDLNLGPSHYKSAPIATNGHTASIKLTLFNPTALYAYFTDEATNH